ncbi:hypothetical protein [Labrenzia sp. OB1]|uniref:hypothetical protein n=1 Tax=Labrenzia sp. OB1 TaxID=1561204 RepID=UPI0012E8125D|nr:hypothetical protein [Labrenzia sp. OB1]
MALLLHGPLLVQASACGVNTVWRVSFGETPGLTEPGKKSTLIEFIENMTVGAGIDLQYQVVPFKRSLISVSAGHADMHVPLLQSDDNLLIDENLMYSEASFFEVPFNVYMEADSEISGSDIWSGGELIETDAAHTHFFPFSVTGSHCMECSLRKLVRGRIDAYIYAEVTTERTIKKLDFGHKIRREFYKTFPVKAVLPRNECGEELNRKLNSLVPAARRATTNPTFRAKPKTPELSN